MSDLMQYEQLKYSVPWRVVEYIDVAARARELGCRVPYRLALLPGNFATAASAVDFHFHEVAAQVRAGWRSIGLVDTGPLGAKDKGQTGESRIQRPETRIQNVRKLQTLDSGFWVLNYPDPLAPVSENVPLTVFFGADLLRVAARPVLHAIGVVASILLDDPSSANAREVLFNAVVERPYGRGYACLEYHGDACELIALAKSVRTIWGVDTMQPVSIDHADIRGNPARNRFVRARASGLRSVREEPRAGSHNLQEVRKVVVTR